MEREQQLSGVFNQCNIGAAITTPEKGWHKVNTKLWDMRGSSQDELKKNTWSEFTLPNDLKSDAMLFNRILVGEIENYELETRFIRKDGVSSLPISLSPACEMKKNVSNMFFQRCRNTFKQKLIL